VLFTLLTSPAHYVPQRAFHTVWKPDAGFTMRAYLSPMQIRVAGAVVALSAAALSGCTSEPLPEPTSPAPTSTPVFASEAEALAAAEASYAAFQTLSDQILADGGRDPDRIRTVATRDALIDALKGYTNFRTKGWRLIGNSTSVITELQRVSPSAASQEDVVTAYLCIDVSGTDVLNASDISVVQPSRPKFQSFSVAFDLTKTAVAPSLILSKRVPWSGGGVCEQ
jgi:hypothetical protein